MFCCKLPADISEAELARLAAPLSRTFLEAEGMNPRRRLLIALLAILPAMGASYRTTNFVVQAPTPQIAQQVGQWAEHYRKEKAMLWLGQEMPAWGQPCPLVVHVTMDGPSGATSFNFGQDAYGRGQILGMHMEIQGPLDRLINSVLPHEITHTVFAYYFRCPVPRWADEGGSVLSEDDVERERHDKLVRQILNRNRQIRLRQLFGLMKYPSDVMCLYAEGYSMSDYLVKRSGRQQFLQFVAHGMNPSYGWDSAVRTFYQHKNVEELEETWLKHLRETRGQPHIMVAQDKGATSTDPAARTVVRLTAPPTQPLQAQPVIRGQAPEEGPPRYLPPPEPPPVQLGRPEFGPPPSPSWASPAGFPR
jgi:hypothetical protein